MEESIKVRNERNDLLAARRMGMPEDDVFEDLNKWWEDKERAFGLEEECTSDEESDKEED